MSAKICNKCHRSLPLSDFGTRTRKGRTFPLHRCRACSKEDHRATYKKWSAKPDARQKIRNWSFKSLYGITLIEWQEMFARQGGLCAICSEAMIGTRGAHVDHNHDTGQVRDLLCTRCNAGLGYFKEDLKLFECAMGYLRRWGR